MPNVCYSLRNACCVQTMVRIHVLFPVALCFRSHLSHINDKSMGSAWCNEYIVTTFASAHCQLHQKPNFIRYLNQRALRSTIHCNIDDSVSWSNVKTTQAVSHQTQHWVQCSSKHIHFTKVTGQEWSPVHRDLPSDNVILPPQMHLPLIVLAAKLAFLVVLTG